VAPDRVAAERRGAEGGHVAVRTYDVDPHARVRITAGLSGRREGPGASRDLILVLPHSGLAGRGVNNSNGAGVVPRRRGRIWLMLGRLRRPSRAKVCAGGSP